MNILAELYCDGGQWAEALAVVEGAERQLLGLDEELPIDLTVGEGARLRVGGCAWVGGFGKHQADFTRW